MQIAFDHRPSKLKRRKKFERRVWRSDEIFNEYYYDKLILRNQVPIDKKDMLDYVINDIIFRNQARLQSLNSVSALFETFKKISIQNNTKSGWKAREAHSREKLNNQLSSSIKSEKFLDKDTRQERRIRYFNKLELLSKISREPKKKKKAFNAEK